MTTEELLNEESIFNKFSKLERSIERTSKAADKTSLKYLRDILLIKAYALTASRKLKFYSAILYFTIFIALFSVLCLMGFIINLTFIRSIFFGLSLWLMSLYAFKIPAFLQKLENRYKINKINKMFNTYLEIRPIKNN